MAVEQHYDPPTINNGTWNPAPGECLSGKLVSIAGVAYEFAPTRPLPVLRIAVEMPVDGILAAPDETGTYSRVIPTQFVEVHAGLSERLLKEVQAVRPKDGELIEITVGRELVDGFPEYVVCVGGRWSVAEHWGPETVDSRCVFSAAPADHRPERTAVMRPVTAPCKHTGGKHLPGCSLADSPAQGRASGQLADAARSGFNPYFKPSPTPRNEAGE